MAIFVILSKVSPGSFDSPKDFKRVADTVGKRIREDCPGLTWLQSLSTMGRYDVLDIVETADSREAERASMIIRSLGKSETEVLPAKSWKEFLDGL
jgi:uncharacterized protein with GYD domain